MKIDTILKMLYENSILLYWYVSSGLWKLNIMLTNSLATSVDFSAKLFNRHSFSSCIWLKTLKKLISQSLAVWQSHLGHSDTDSVIKKY